MIAIWFLNCHEALTWSTVTTGTSPITLTFALSETSSLHGVRWGGGSQGAVAGRSLVKFRGIVSQPQGVEYFLSGILLPWK